jgi:hypothetical protein
MSRTFAFLIRYSETRFLEEAGFLLDLTKRTAFGFSWEAFVPFGPVIGCSGWPVVA